MAVKANCWRPSAHLIEQVPTSARTPIGGGSVAGWRRTTRRRRTEWLSVAVLSPSLATIEGPRASQSRRSPIAWDARRRSPETGDQAGWGQRVLHRHASQRDWPGAVAACVLGGRRDHGRQVEERRRRRAARPDGRSAEEDPACRMDARGPSGDWADRQALDAFGQVGRPARTPPGSEPGSPA